MRKESSGAYFFDLLVSDVSGAILNALSILYHGNAEGVFGTKSGDRIDLERLQAIKINISHTSRRISSKDHEYNLVFYRSATSDPDGNSLSREQQWERHALTRHVSRDAKKEPLMRRMVSRFFASESRRPIDYVRFEERVAPDFCVPVFYHNQLFNQFDGYLMRCAPGFPLVRKLFQAQGLRLRERRLASEHTFTTELIVTYSL